MNSLPIISSPWSESWVAWTMLGLLVLVGIAHVMQPQAITMGFRSLFSTGDRSSTFIDTALDKRAQTIMLFFAACVVSMATYIVVFAWTDGQQFSFDNYGLVVLLTTVIMLLRTVFEILVGFTFIPHGGFDAFIDHYYHLAVCTALIHYPILLLCLFCSALTTNAIIILNAAVIIIYLIALFVKGCLMLVHSVRAFFYGLICIITFEIVPALALFLSTYYLITK